MRHLLTACACLSLTGCLEVGDPLLAVRDTQPPQVTATDPKAKDTIAADGSLKVTFSEFMDVRTLRPGIAVYAGRDEVPVQLLVPPSDEVDQNVERGDIPYTVMVSASSGAFAPNANYTLKLRTSLTDYEGNALVEEVDVPFSTSL